MGDFTVTDYFVFFATLVISLAIGSFIAFRDRNKNTPTYYFLAGKNLKIIQTIMSFLASFQSAILILGVPAEAYAYGMMSSYYGVGIFLAMAFSAIFAVPVFYALELTSIYRYFDLRYGSNFLRYSSAVCGIIGTIFYMGVVIYGACLALNVVMGIPFWLAVILYTTVTTAYTSLGGMKAVIWTDVFQFIVMLLGIVALVIFPTIGAGGIKSVFTIAPQRLEMNDFRWDPRIRYQFWNTIFGAFISFLSGACSQTSMQRVKSLPSVKSARIALIIVGVIIPITFVLTTFQGVAIFAFFASKRCDVLASGTVGNINEIVPYAVLELFAGKPGLPGLFCASLTSAAISTLSSGLNSLAAITYDDIVCAFFPSISDASATTVSKVISVIYGILATVIAFAISGLPGSVLSISNKFISCVEGPLIAILVLSILFRRATSKGMVMGLLSGISVTVWLILGKLFSETDQYPMFPPGPIDMCPSTDNQTFLGVISTPSETESFVAMETGEKSTIEPGSANSSVLKAFYSISFMLLASVGFCVTIVVGIVTSMMTKVSENIDERTVYFIKKKTRRRSRSNQDYAFLSQPPGHNAQPLCTYDIVGIII